MPRASRRMASTSSSSRRTLRPLPRPSKGTEVSPGQAMQIASPRPELFRIICRWSPFPKARSRLTETVPQTMPKTVSVVRSFWLRLSRQIWRNASRTESIVSAPGRLVHRGRQLLRRPLEHLRSLGEPIGDLDVQPVRDAELDRRLHRRRLLGRARDVDERLLAAVLENHDA